MTGCGIDWQKELGVKKAELFRQYVLCEMEAYAYQYGADYNLMIVKGVIAKKGLEDDYLEWRCNNDYSRFKRRGKFPMADVLAMLD